MKKSILALGCAIFISYAPANATELVQNGKFNSGLTGWTSYTTANGTIAELPSLPGAPAPQEASVVSFDVAGSGAQNALFLNAGKYNPPYGSAPAEGGGVIQTFTSLDGIATLSASIAAYSRLSVSNVGLLSVLLDGVEVASYDFGDILAGATERSSLSFTTSLAAGTHTLALQAVRPYAPGRGIASQYFTNISFNQVPEPATWAMMIAGFGMVGASMRRRQNVLAAIA